MPQRPPLAARALLLVSLPLIAAGASRAAPQDALPDAGVLRSWVEAIKQSPRGPFERIRWFCRDGTVQPPRAYACADHGGGIQHGEWTARVRALRAGGYRIANVIAELEADQFVGADADLAGLKQILLERFLMRIDNGWVMRGALTYRGALQAEDEEAGARRVTLALLADPLWREPARYALLREVVRLLPLGVNDPSTAEVRHLALVIAEKDPNFTPLRVKIHGVPDAGDARSVREYARTSGKAALSDQYEKLAVGIDRLYAGGGALEALEALAVSLEGSQAAATLRSRAAALGAARNPAERLQHAAGLSADLRRRYEAGVPPESGLLLVQASLVLEDAAFVAGNELTARLDASSRRQRLQWIGWATKAAYGAGLVGGRHLEGVRASLDRVQRADPLTLDDYRLELRYLARGPEWAGRWLEFTFGDAVQRLEPLEPLAHLYPQDRLRGSPLLVYGALVDSLVRDANSLAGIEHRLFGERVGAGLRALNPGLARGVLYSSADAAASEALDSSGIYLLPETTSDLPPVSGILTRGEGSSLSHVQLLARNLGIPNVVVNEQLLPRVEAEAGQRVVLAVSPSGVVQLSRDSSEWDRVFGMETGSAVEIVPDLKKLDLKTVRMISLDELRAEDSGRVSGPKGANLGHLRNAFGDVVPNGFVIPFGVFRRQLDRPLAAGGPSVWDWMRERYAAIDRARGSERERMVREFLGQLRGWITHADPGPEFRKQLRETLASTFGEDGSYGVFVRSDTNVEDLPGFTGAGLNLTVPNVVGYQNVLAAVQAVWASPFTERAYGWRQAHMKDPEYVFPAVVVQYSFPAEKSGVMVTSDVEDGRPGWLTIAVNEGVGGAVEGQSTESLLVNVRNGEVRFLAQATARQRAVLASRGGVEHRPASGAEEVLTGDEIAQLISLAKEIPHRFPSLRNEIGLPLAADVEFAFRGGRLALLQLRPFVESKGAQRSTYLSSLDADLRSRGRRALALDGVPDVAAR